MTTASPNVTPGTTRTPAPSRLAPLAAFALVAFTAIPTLAAQPDGVPTAAPTTAPTTAPSRPITVDEPRARYNALVLGLRERVRSPGMTDELLADAARSFIAESRALPGGIAFLGEVARLHAGIERVLAGETAGVDDLGQSGPALTGIWRVAQTTPNPSLAAQRVGGAVGASTAPLLARFEPVAPGSRATALEFERVPVSDQGGETRAIYVLRRPMTVREAIGAVRAQYAEPELRRLMPPVPPAFDARQGAWTWSWSQPGDADRAMLEPAGPGSADQGIQHIPPSVAVLLAAAVGGRLPTSAEWGAIEQARATSTQGPQSVFLLDGVPPADGPEPRAEPILKMIDQHGQGLGVGRFGPGGAAALAPERRDAGNADIGVLPVFDAPLAGEGSVATGPRRGGTIRTRLSALLDPPPLLRVR